MHEEYRIISNSITAANDNGSLVSVGQTRHPSSHFADNNYFFTVVQTIQEIGNNSFNPEVSRLVLRWPNETYYKNGDDEAERSQRAALKRRFPYKFFYMWTHGENVLRMVSLMAYRNLVKQKDMLIRYNCDQDMDEDFAHFIGSEGWQKYSEAIKAMIPEDKRGENFVGELSKLLSIVMCHDQDTKSMKALLDSGNKAIVLWGPPGTGKTYSAETLVCQELEISRAELEDYHFDENNVHGNGCWDIVQFHPNYTYEDFIGGISPQLHGDSLSYTLREGIFKRICDTACRDENRGKKFILIIDEINRADLSAVFGELMYALEYRNRKVKIPNFNRPFVIPDNVWLIGTMNSVDKSLVTFDLALRRRFGFYRIMPNINLLPTILDEYQIDNLGEYMQRCELLNSDIAKKLHLGDDYQIGHAYFAKIKDFIPDAKNNEDGICHITCFQMGKLWMYHLLPLIEEYLGGRIDDGEMQVAIKEMETRFTKPFKP